MTLALPPDWPVCGAPNTEHRRLGTLCRARGDGWGQRCRHHGGLELPEGPHAIVVSPAGVFVWRTFRGVLHHFVDARYRDRVRQRVSWNIAALLVEQGTVDRAFLFGRKGGSLIRRLRTVVDVRKVGPGAKTALGLTQYAFRRRAAA